MASLRSALDSALDAAMEPVRSAPGPLGVLFSGGVDSSLLAWDLRSRSDLTLYTLGRERSDDLAAGRNAAERLGLPWVALAADEAGVAEAEARFAAQLTGISPVVRAVLVALAMAIQAAPPPILVCGQGADELFLGYSHFGPLDGAAAERRSAEDLHRLLTEDWPRTQKIAAQSGKLVLAPFLAPAFIERARAVPIALRLPRDLPKRFFREWAVHRGLPAELSLQPKKAVQYGSGVASLLRARQRPGR